MRNVTTTMVVLAREARKSGQSMWPISLGKIDELAEYLQRVDRLVTAVESFNACVGDFNAQGYPWTDDEVEGMQYLRDALREVQS